MQLYKQFYRKIFKILVIKSNILRALSSILMTSISCGVINSSIQSSELSSAKSDDPTCIGDSVVIYNQSFGIESHVVTPTPGLREFASCIDSIMKADTIKRVSVIGLASIDGPESLNRRLAKARAFAMTDWLTKTVHIPDSIIYTAYRGEDWSMFRALIEDDPSVPARAQIMDILNSNRSYAAKEVAIKALDKGNTWAYLAKNIFPQMRCAEVTLGFKHRFIVPVTQEILEPESVETEVMEEIAISPEPLQGEELYMEEEQEEWVRNFYIKTDLPYWVLSWVNAAFEVDLAPHWSFNLPVYYSACNYFKHTIKFRIFGFQPGFRYWLKPDNKGVYFEAHYGMAWYDFAFNGKYRYQDYRRKTPAVGGGIAAGYRMPVSKNGRWMMEFGGGVGVYKLHYNRFINDYNGKLVDSKKKTYFGLDNVNVSISYTFPIEKRKGGGN